MRECERTLSEVDSIFPLCYMYMNGSHLTELDWVLGWEFHLTLTKTWKLLIE